MSRNTETLASGLIIQRFGRVRVLNFCGLTISNGTATYTLPASDRIITSSLTIPAVVVVVDKYYTGYLQMINTTSDKGKIFVRTFSYGSGANSPSGTVYGMMAYCV